MCRNSASSMRHCRTRAAEPLAGAAPANCPGPELLLPTGKPSGIIASDFSPLQKIREDFGTTRVDHIFSDKDTLTGAYTIDDGEDVTATVADPFSTDIVNLREQVLSVEETHAFSPALLNTARFGYSRAGYYLPGGANARFTGGERHEFCGGLAGGSGGRWRQHGIEPCDATRPRGQQQRNESGRIPESVHIRGSGDTDAREASICFGVWLQQFQSNEVLALSQFGQASFSGINALLGGVVGTFTYDPAPTEMNWRSLFAAWYAEDTIRLTPQADVDTGLPRRILDRMERSAWPGRQLLLHGWRDQFHSATWGVPPSASTTQSSCRSRESAWRGARSARRRCCARGSGCTTTCKTRSDTEWIRTRPSIPRMHQQPAGRRFARAGFLSRYPPAGCSKAGSGRCAAELEAADADLVFASARAAVDSEHVV